MSIEYNVSPNGLRIDTRVKGVLDIKQTIEYFDRLKLDERIKPGAIEIVYFNDVTDFKLSYLESGKITKNYQEPKEYQLIDTKEFVCKTDLAYGIGRILQTLHEITNPKHVVKVVRSENEIYDFITK